MTGLDRQILQYIKENPSCNVKDIDAKFRDHVAFEKNARNGSFLWFGRLIGKLSKKELVARDYIGNGVRLSLTQKGKSLL